MKKEKDRCVPVEVDAIGTETVLTTVLAPETVVVPGVVIAVDVHDGNDHKLCVAQDGRDVVILAVVARQVVGQELDYESITSYKSKA